MKPGAGSGARTRSSVALIDVNPFDVDTFLATGGLIGLCLLIFCETGLLFGFLFPGDTLLFTAGILAAQPNPYAPLWLPLVAVPVCAILGDQCGYFLGRRVGADMLAGKVIRYIGQEPVDRTQRFFARYGAITIFFGRFIGIVRTLVPPLAGFSRMRWRNFTIFSVAGAIVWGSGIIALGYLLGNVRWIADNISWMLAASALTIVIPIVVQLIRRYPMRRHRSQRTAAADGSNDMNLTTNEDEPAMTTPRPSDN